MERIMVENNAEEFDRIVHSGLKEGGDIKFVIKPKATVGGKAAVVVSFTVELPNGQRHTAQAVTTLQSMCMATTILRALQQELDPV